MASGVGGKEVEAAEQSCVAMEVSGCVERQPSVDGGKTSEEALARLSPPAAAAAEDWPGKACASDILR